MNLVDYLYERFLFFADSAMMVGFKLTEKVFDHHGVDIVVG